ADAGVADVSAHKTVAHDERVRFIELIVDARIDPQPALRRAEDVCKGIDDNQGPRIERDCIDDGPVVDCFSFEVQKERGPLLDWTTKVPTQFIQQEWRLLLRIGIARVPEAIGEVVGAGATKLVRAGLSEDLDAAKAELVVLRREGILVDSNLANGIL